VSITLPKDPALAGKKLQLSVRLPLTYARVVGTNNTFDVGSATFSDTLWVHIADPADAASFRTSFRPGVIGAGAAFIGGLCLMLLTYAQPKKSAGQLLFAIRH
jgi:hypothetical protein